MMRGVVAAIVLVAAMVSPRVAAAQTYHNGIFIATPHGPIELTAWAEVARSGQLRMAKGELGNVPTITDFLAVLCNLPNWRPGGVMIASELIFHDERAERRQVPYALKLKSISAFEVRVEDLERSETMAELIRAVRATDDFPAYAFVVMTANGLNRLYPFRVKAD